MPATTTPDPDRPTYPHVQVRLSGTDGNVFMLIGRVSAALRRQAGTAAADGFATAAYQCGSYDEVIQLAMATVSIS